MRWSVFNGNRLEREFTSGVGVVQRIELRAETRSWKRTNTAKEFLEADASTNVETQGGRERKGMVVRGKRRVAWLIGFRAGATSCARGNCRLVTGAWAVVRFL